MLCQIIKLHLEQSGTWISCHFGQIVHFLIKAPKLGEGVLYVSSKLDVGPQWAVGASPISKAETFQKGRTYFIFEPKWPLLNTKQLWPLQVLLFNASLIS